MSFFISFGYRKQTCYHHEIYSDIDKEIRKKFYDVSQRKFGDFGNESILGAPGTSHPFARSEHKQTIPLQCFNP